MSKKKIKKESDKTLIAAISTVMTFGSTFALGGGVPTGNLDAVIVTGSLIRLQGEPQSATQGVVTEDQLVLRPVLRTGELLETVPGLVVTQHSGAGKANQYFLRGFNLDHGTDFAASVDAVPVNMPTHAHGQGYTDLNFVIPEFLQSIEYRKGPYYAETGNFSAAGAANMSYRSSLNQPVLITVEGGEDDYYRAVLGLSHLSETGAVLFGLEYSTSDGPWQLPQDYRKVNGLLKYSLDTDDSRFAMTLQGYDGRWMATDQIPERAVLDGSLDRFGYVDPTNGGDTHRYSLAGEWSLKVGTGTAHALLYAVDYELDLFSNFTYFINPAGPNQTGGDQFEQFDDRRIYGGEIGFSQPFDWLNAEQSFDVGVQWRQDDIETVGLYLTTGRQRHDTVREDSVVQNSYAAYGSLNSRWGSKVRSVLGVRADRYDFKVDSDNLANSGKAHDTLASPKLSLIFGPWSETEIFLNVGRGFHSNDARGTTITVDPADDVTPVDKVDPLVKGLGYDVGVRTALIPNAQLSLALFHLDLDSELLYIGDAGATEASGATTRRGVEVGVVYNPINWLIIDADAAWSHSRFDSGDYIPNAVESVVSMGVAINHPSGFNGGLRVRNFGSAPLIEDNSIRSSPTTVVNAEVGFASRSGWKASLGVYNVFDSQDNDITYYYESQLANEAAPVEDIHFHPVEPRTVRASVGFSF